MCWMGVTTSWSLSWLPGNCANLWVLDGQSKGKTADKLVMTL